MKGFFELLWVETKIFLRQPEAFFFTLVFPLLLLFLFGSIYGNKPNPFFGGRGTVDFSTPAYMAMIICSTGLLSIAIAVSSYREKGILRRYRATPLRPGVVIASQIVLHLIMTALGAGLLIVAARLVYGLKFPGRASEVAAAFILCSLSFFAAGFLVAGLARTARAAYIIGMVLYFPNLFLSGATFPKEMFPEPVKAVGRFIPLTHVVNLLQGLWFGQPWSRFTVETVFLGALLVVGAAVSAKTFRWE